MNRGAAEDSMVGCTGGRASHGVEAVECMVHIAGYDVPALDAWVSSHIKTWLGRC